MRIGIIGGGSIGLLFAAYLSEAFTVNVYTKTVEQSSAINQAGGISLLKEKSQTMKKVKARPINCWNGQEDLTIVAVKQYQLEPIVNQLNQFPEETLNILFLQNGMGHIKLLSQLHAKNIYIGSVEHGAFKENAFTVRHNGEGLTNLAVYKGNSGNLSSFCSLMPNHFPIKWNDDYYEMLMNKLIINAAINPLTAILHVPNGMLIENEFYFKALKSLFDEITQVLCLTEADQYFQKLVLICRKTAENKSSMLKDIESGSKTEVDAILGFLMETAKEKGKGAPLISSFYYLIKGTETEESC